MSSAKDAKDGARKSRTVESLTVAFADTIKLIRDDKRTSGQIAPLLEAFQSVIDGNYFVVQKRDLQQMLFSTDYREITQAWQTLYNKWGFTLEVPAFPFDSNLVSLEWRSNRMPIYVDEKAYYFDGIPRLRQAANVPASAPLRGLKQSWDYCKGWLFVTSGFEPKITGDSLQSLKEQNISKDLRLDMNLSTFLVYFAVMREIYRSELQNCSPVCELLLGATYGNSKQPAQAIYHNYNQPILRRGSLPENIKLSARSVIRYEYPYVTALLG